MKQLAPILKLLNTLVVDQLKKSVRLDENFLLEVDAEAEKADIRAKDGAEDGVSFEKIRARVRKLHLPSPENPDICGKAFLDQMTIRLTPELMKRVAEHTGQKFLEDFCHVLDRIEIRDIDVTFYLNAKAKKRVDAKVHLGSVELYENFTRHLQVQDMKLTVCKLYTEEKDKEKQMEELEIFLDDLKIRVAQSFLNQAVSMVKPKFPPEIQDLGFEFPANKMVIAGRVKKGLSVKFRVDLKFMVQSDKFGVRFERFYVPGTNMGIPDWVRNMLLKIGSKAAGDKIKPAGLVQFGDEYVLVNPFIAIPVTLRTLLSRFTIEDKWLVLEFKRDEKYQSPGEPEILDGSFSKEGLLGLVQDTLEKELVNSEEPSSAEEKSVEDGDDKKAEVDSEEDSGSDSKDEASASEKGSV